MKVQDFALGLKEKYNLKFGDRIAILSQNSPSWVISDMAILALSLISVPIYTTLTAQEIKKLLNNCGAKGIIVSNFEALEKIISIKKDCPSLKFILSIKKLNKNILTIKHIQKIGQNLISLKQAKFIKNIQTIKRKDVASIVYTSGSTDESKGVMLTHGNFLTNVEDINKCVSLSDKDSVLSFLPLSHVLERTAGYYTLLYIGGSIYYADDITTISNDIKLAKPTVIISVPRLFQKIQAKMLGDLHGFKKFIFYWAKGIGVKHYLIKKRGQEPLYFKILYKIAHKLVFAKIAKKLGGNLRFCVSGGSPLPKKIGQFFKIMGVNIIEGYGLTETSPVISVNRLEKNKFGTVGLALDSVQVKLAKDGELLAKGPSIMKGYYKMPKKTKETIDKDGWMHTGDIAIIDKQGFIKIVDRKKELIVLSNGKKVAPQPLEINFASSRYITQIVIIGENKNYLTALIVPNFKELEKFLDNKNIKYKNHRDIIKNSLILELFDNITVIKQANFAPYKQIKKYTLLAKEFSIENEELTPTLKIKRRIIDKIYAKKIKQMY